MTDHTNKSSTPYVLIDRVPDMTTLAERLQAVMKGMDGPGHGAQVRLAEIAGCTRGTMNNYLSKPGASIGYEFAKNIADRLNYSVDWLIMGRGDPRTEERKTAPVMLVYVDETEAQLLTMYRESDAGGKEYIFKSANLTEKSPSQNIGSAAGANKSK